MAELLRPLDPPAPVGAGMLPVVGLKQWVVVFALVGAAFAGVAKVSHALELPHHFYPTLCFTAGILLAAFLLAAPRQWPWLLTAALTGFLLPHFAPHPGNLRTSLASFCLQAVAAMVCAYFLRRTSSPYRIASLRMVWIFAGCTAFVSAVVVAPIGGLLTYSLRRGLFLDGYSHWFLAFWGAVWLITPAVLFLAQNRGRFLPAWEPGRVIELTLLFLTLAVASLSMFGGAPSIISLPSLLLMWAMWAVLRFGSGGASGAMLVIGLPALLATVHEAGPFVRSDRPIAESIIRLLVYLVLWSGFFQIAGAILAERERAVSDLASLNRDLEGRVKERTHSLSEAGEALRSSESKLRSYYEAAPLFMGLVELEEDDVFHLYDNPASCRYFGVPPGSTSGKRSREFATSPAAVELWLACFRLSSQRAEPTRFERAFPVGKDGERWLSITVTPLAGESSDRPRFSYVAEDVTSRRRTETALRKHAARQTALLEVTRAIFSQNANRAALAVALFHRVSEVLDADLGLNYQLDPQTQTLHLVAAFGLPDERIFEAQQLPLLTTFCGTVAANCTAIMADMERIETDPKGSFVRSMGAHCYACHPLLAADGRMLGTLSFGSRKRERFEPEEINFLQTLCHYVALAWERAAAEEEMANAKNAAEAANRAKDDFLAALSHELRTPLNPVLLLASELQNQPELSPEVLADLATIRRNVELEARLIDDLLDLTRITRGKVSLEVRPTHAHRVLRESLQILEAEVAAKELELVWKLNAPRDVVLADPVRLQQVLWNVLRNAIKFTPPSGAVTLSTHETPENRLVIEISDTGPGIASEHLATIFETFNQGPGGHRFGGLGLGLAIARSIVEMHGGSISAESAGNGQGATFRIEWPLLLQVVPGSLPPTENGTAELPAPALPSLRILLVEDHEPTRTALTRLLQRRRHQVTPADSLGSARRAAETGHFDLLISDLGLPDGDGVDLMRQFQSSGGPPGIALSGYGMDEDLRRTRGAGFFAHLVKPVDVDMLDRTLELWSRQSATPATNGKTVAEVKS